MFEIKSPPLFENSKFTTEVKRSRATRLFESFGGPVSFQNCMFDVRIQGDLLENIFEMRLMKALDVILLSGQESSFINTTIICHDYSAGCATEIVSNTTQRFVTEKTLALSCRPCEAGWYSPGIPIW